MVLKLSVLTVEMSYVLTAGSALEAASILSQHKDIALVFIDVVMEDDSGLRLVLVSVMCWVEMICVLFY